MMANFTLLPTDEPLLDALVHEQARVLRVASPGMAYIDIARELGVPVGTVKSRLNRARLKIVELRAKREAEIALEATNRGRPHQ